MHNNWANHGGYFTPHHLHTGFGAVSGASIRGHVYNTEIGMGPSSKRCVWCASHSKSRSNSPGTCPAHRTIILSHRSGGGRLPSFCLWSTIWPIWPRPSIVVVLLFGGAHFVLSACIYQTKTKTKKNKK